MGQYSCWAISVARQTRRAFTLAYTPITSPLLIRAVTTVNLTVVECTELLVSPRTKSLLLPHTRASPSRSAKGLLQISQELIKRLLQPHETARVELQICKSHAQFARNLLVSVRRSLRSFPQFPVSTYKHHTTRAIIIFGGRNRAALAPAVTETPTLLAIKIFGRRCTSKIQAAGGFPF